MVSKYWKWKPEEYHHPMPEKGVCFDCGKKIIWAYDENARPQPLDPEVVKIAIITHLAGEQYAEIVEGHRLHRQTCEERKPEKKPERRRRKPKASGE